MDLNKAENYLNKELGFVKNTLISYPEVIKAMAKYAESQPLTILDVVRQSDVNVSLPLNAIINPHYDKYGRLDGGLVIENGVAVGHIDPIGESGTQGVAGNAR
jgi:hypothetical protein